jgi:hypothetical protein
LRARIIVPPALIFLFSINFAYAQEERNLKSYFKETGNSYLEDGCWLKKDRKRQNEVWKKANVYNLSVENGSARYETISQIRDYYLWFDVEREKLGCEIKWIGIAAIAAGQLSKLDNGFIRLFLVRNKEVVKFANKGSKQVFEFAFPLLKEVYFSTEIIKGKEAENWDLEYGKIEQCKILDPLYKELSHNALRKLDRMACGKGLYRLGVPKELKYAGSIEDCQARFEHGINIMIPFYQAQKESKNHLIKK